MMVGHGCDLMKCYIITFRALVTIA
jgi:hypothetical protein